MKRLGFLLLALLASPLVMAQWQYKDEKGQTVFSDQPPPPSTKRSDIIKAPPGFDAPRPQAVQPTSLNQKGSTGGRPNYGDTAQTAAADGKPAEAKKPEEKTMTAADKDAELQKKKKEQAEAQAKTEKEAQAAKDKQQACNASKEALRNLESGARIATTNEKGERAYLDDAERATRTVRARDAVSRSCT